MTLRLLLLLSAATLAAPARADEKPKDPQAASRKKEEEKKREEERKRKEEHGRAGRHQGREEHHPVASGQKPAPAPAATPAPAPAAAPAPASAKATARATLPTPPPVPANVRSWEGACDPATRTRTFRVTWDPAILDGRPWGKYLVSGANCAAPVKATCCEARVSGCTVSGSQGLVQADYGDVVPYARSATVGSPGIPLPAKCN